MSQDKAKLRDIEGKKFRMQMTTYLFLCNFIFCSVFIMIAFISPKFNKDIVVNYTYSDVLDVLFYIVGSFLILILLRLINIFFAGKIICVVDQNGIYYKGGFIRWKDVRKIEYRVGIPSRYSIDNSSFSCVHITGWCLDTVIMHMPSSFLGYVKRHKPGIKTSYTPGSVATMIFLLAFPIVVSILIPWFYSMN